MMPLTFWIILWKIVLIGGIGLFAVLAVVVTVGGARDVVTLLRELHSATLGDETHEVDEQISPKIDRQ